MRLDLTGKKFNRLTVIKPVGQDKSRVIIWECKCDCGKVVNVRGVKVKSGSTKSCGCFKMENIKHEGQDHPQWDGFGEISKSFYSRMITAAKLRGWAWELDIKYLWELFLKQEKKCALTGIELLMPIHLRQLTKRNQIIASLDRIDPNQPYVKNNVRWVCKRVNYMKHTQDDNIFFQFIKSIYEYNQLNLIKQDLSVLSSSKNHAMTECSKIRKYKTKGVKQFDLVGNFIKQYKSCGEASLDNSISINIIRSCCQEKRKNCGQYIWKYVID